MRIVGTLLPTLPGLPNVLIRSVDHAGRLPARDVVRVRLQGGRSADGNIEKEHG